jgi:hypothetical protein
MNLFLRGVNATLAMVIALFFARAWRRVGDRFFLLFSAAFGLMAVNQLIIALIGEADDWTLGVYGVRLFAYLLIIAAILDKNRTAR